MAVDREAYIEAVLVAVESIPPGRVATYGDIAAYVGRSGPRQVGAVMLEYGGSVPWWRVIRSSGIPADGLAERQLYLLSEEGIEVVDGRVMLRNHRWIPRQGAG